MEVLDKQTIASLRYVHGAYHLLMIGFFVYLVEVRGFTALGGGFVAMVPWFAASIGGATGGWTCDRLTRSHGIRRATRISAIGALLLAALLLFGGAAAERAWLAVLCLSACFAFVQFTDGAYWAATTSVSGRYAAAACGLLNTGGNIVGGFGALLVPIVAERFGWVAALSTGSIFAVLAALLWLFIRADEPLRTGSQGSAVPD